MGGAAATVRDESGALLHERDERGRVFVLNGTEPVALVLIGHAGDARQWQCTAATQAECANAFVVDRIDWAAGHDVPLAAPRPATSSRERRSRPG